MFHNVAEFIAFQARQRPEALFAKDAAGALSFAEAVAEIGKIGARLSGEGFKPGDRIGILAANSVDLILLVLAAGKIGVVAVPINFRLSAPEVSYILENAECKALFFDADFASLIEAGSSERTRKVCFSGDQPECPSFRTWLHDGPVNEGAAREDVGGNDVFVQLYTSGTTGRPKGAQLTHAGFIANNFQVNLAHGCFPQAGERVLMVAPNFHAVGLSGALWSLCFGAGVIVHREFNPQLISRVIAEESIATMMVVPVMLKFIVEQNDVAQYDFSSLKLVVYGGSPISPSLLSRCVDVLGCKFAQGYGQTEATTGITVLSPESHLEAVAGREELLSSCGKPVFATALRIVDEEGALLPVDEVGEVQVRGPQIMSGYWKLPEATAETIREGWLSTGDMGCLDSEGYLYLKDRLKDMIISGGENVYPAEIEAVLSAHPDIADVAVVGMADEKWGEVPVAFVVSAKPLPEAELETFSRQRLAGFKAPKHYRFVDQLPRNASGKLLKRELRALLS